VSYERQGTNNGGLVVESEGRRKPIYLNASRRTRRDEPFLFQLRKRSANMNCRNSADVPARRIDCRWIRDRVDGGDKEQQANQPNGILEFQNVLERKETISLAKIPFQGNNILQFVLKY
jgi:hypothetical protein